MADKHLNTRIPSLRKKILSQAGVTGIFRAISLLSGFAAAVFLARILGVEGLGVYASCLALLTILSLPLEFGLPTLVTREVAKYLHSEDYQEVRGVLIFGMLFVLFLFVPVFFLAKQIIPIMPWSDLIIGYSYWWLILFYIVFIGISSLLSACLAGAHLLIESQLSVLVVRPVVFLGVLFFLQSTMAASFSVLHALWAQAFSVAVSMVLVSIFFGCKLASRLKEKKSTYHLSYWFSSTWKFGLVNGIRRAQPQILLLLLSLLASAESVGFFRVCQRGASLVAFGSSLVTTTLTPYISTLYANRELTRLGGIMSGAAKAMTAWSMIFLCLFVFAGKPILSFVFGPEYAMAYSILVVFSIVQFVASYFGMSFVMLNMSGQEAVSLKLMAINLSVSALGTLLLVPVFGALGAALAYGFSSILVYWYANKAVWDIHQLESSFWMPFRPKLARS